MTRRRGALGVGGGGWTALAPWAGAPLLVACVAVVEPGALTEGCGEGNKACGLECVSMRNPRTGCGSDDCTPCNIPNAIARCDASGACVRATCTADFDDCDGDESNGCETDLAHDEVHCGACGVACPALPHARPGCAGGACSIGGCEGGYGDCDGQAANGCETDVASDPAHCGGCAEACASGERCEEGTCMPD